MKIPFSPPDISQLEIDEVTDTLRSGWITTGPKTKLFEKELAGYCGTKYAVCLNSATAAMELALKLYGVGPGDEVITSAYTYTASASVIVHAGATPVLVDTAPGSYQMDTGMLEKAVTAKTKAIIPVDIAGVPCDYDKITAVAENKKAVFTPKGELQEALGRILVLADSAHAFGSELNGRRCGSIADFTCFSFHAVKSLTTAEGGCVTWREDFPVSGAALYKKLMLLSLHGQDKDALAKAKAGAWEYDIIAPYYKYNMTDIMASIGLAQLKRYEGLLKRRAEITDLYDRLLKNLDISVLKHHTDEFDTCRHLYMLRLNGKTERERNAVISGLADMGIASNVHFKPLPMMSAYKRMGFSISDYPNAYAQYANEITLPLHTLLTDGDVEYVSQALIKTLG